MLFRSVLRHPRVVRGALEGQVQGDLHAQLASAGHQGLEVLESAQVGVDGVVAAIGGANAVKEARIALTGNPPQEYLWWGTMVGNTGRLHLVYP